MLSESECYGDLLFKLKKVVSSNIFSAQLIKIITHYKKIGYNINVLQQTACLVINGWQLCSPLYLQAGMKDTNLSMYHLIGSKY